MSEQYGGYWVVIVHLFLNTVSESQCLDQCVLFHL